MRVCRFRCLVLATGPAVVLSGCGLVHYPVLDPHGTVALAERNLLFVAVGLMLVVVIPVWVLTFVFVRRYRASNSASPYRPGWTYSPRLDAVIWLVPAVIVAVLGYLLWTDTHRLDPYKPIPASGSPLKVQAVALDWKWLFIYPEQNLAAVNELVFPSDRPVSLELTSDTVMNSFYVPGLGGQIFAMAGMRTALNLRADRPADFVGRNMQYSGRGFADQSFAVHATTEAKFRHWVADARASQHPLDAASLAALAKPSAKVPVSYYSAVAPGLFADIIARYAGRPREAR